MINKILAISTAVIMLQACSSKVNQHYQDLIGGVDVNQYKMASPNEVEILQGADKVQDTVYLLKNNYINIGRALFYSDTFDMDEIKEQAQQVNASLVLVYSVHIANKKIRTPSISYDEGTYSELSEGDKVRKAASRGARSFYSETGELEKKIFHTDTTYWIKMKPPVFGSYIDIMPDESKPKIGISNGVIAAIVINDSPAAKAGIQRGDVIQKIGDKTVVDDSSYRQAIKLYAGKEVTVELVRKGETLSIPVKLGARS